MEIDLPDVVAEGRAAFARYEKALVNNDVITLDVLSRDDPRTICYGARENFYGFGEVRAFRAAHPSVGLQRTLSKTAITTFDRNFAVVSTLFNQPSDGEKIGRQMQTWARFTEGWRAVAAHGNVIDG